MTTIKTDDYLNNLYDMARRLSNAKKVDSSDYLEILDMMAPLPEIYYKDQNGEIAYKRLSWTSKSRWNLLPESMLIHLKKFIVNATFLPRDCAISPFDGSTKSKLQLHQDESVFDRLIYRVTYPTRGRTNRNRKSTVNKTTFFISDSYPQEWCEIMKTGEDKREDSEDKEDSEETIEMESEELNGIPYPVSDGTVSDEEPIATHEKIEQLIKDPQITKEEDDEESEFIKIGKDTPGIMTIPPDIPQGLSAQKWENIKAILKKYRKLSQHLRNMIYVGPDDEFSLIEQDEVDCGFLSDMDFSSSRYNLYSDDEDAFNKLVEILSYFDYCRYAKCF